MALEPEQPEGKEAEDAPDVTLLLRKAGAGDVGAMREVFPLIYDELKRRAKFLEQPGQTLNATALVHEAYLKLARGKALVISDRRHFYNLAAKAMENLLRDAIDRKKAEKRGGKAVQVNLSAVEPAAADPVELIAIRDVLDRLEAIDARGAEVVRLRIFSGLSELEIGELLALGERQVRRIWRAAVDYIHQKLREMPA